MSEQPGELIQSSVDINGGYDAVLTGLVDLLDQARRQAARSVNAVMTATYWEIGRRLVEVEQGGQGKADYGQQIVERLSHDLTARFGRGFGRRNLFQMRAFYLAYLQKVQTVSAQLDNASLFPLPWSHYVEIPGRQKSERPRILRDGGAARRVVTAATGAAS